MNINDRILLLLFRTGAIRIAPAGKPFWYTSGTIGPYYINTHFLFGGQKKAEELLELIDRLSGEREKLLNELVTAVKKNLEQDDIYSETCLLIKRFLLAQNDNNAEIISGGERRDWFFSLPAAIILKKKHVFLFKDKEALTVDFGKEENNRADAGLIFENKDLLSGKGTLHIADLVTEASSYERTWIPALLKQGASIKKSITVVDRLQGGEDVLHRNNIELLSLVRIDENMFETALKNGLIDDNQKQILLEYKKEPKKAMQAFLEKNPGLISDTIKKGGKDAERAKICLDKNIYNL